MSCDLEQVFSYVDAHRSRYLAQLTDYLRIPSISVDGTGIDETSSWVAGLLTSVGLSTEIIPTSGNPVVLAHRHPDASRPTVLLYGHYDVQPPGPPEEWDSDPFDPTLRNGRIYARGAGDNKGQHLAQVLAIEALLACDGELPCNVLVLLDGEEEIGSPSLQGFVEGHRDALHCDLVVTADGPLEADGRGMLSLGVRGCLSFELCATGASSDLHSGNWGNVAPNPLWKLVGLLASMRNAAGEITIDGFSEDIVPPTEEEREALRSLPHDERAAMDALGTEELDPGPDIPIAERLAFRPTLNISGVHGGYDGPDNKTVIPNAAIAKCDIRLVYGQTLERVWGQIQEHIARYAPSVEARLMGADNPSRTPLDSPYTQVLLQALESAQGMPPLLVPVVGGTLPDYCWTEILGAHAFCTPYANHDERNHAANENLCVDNYIRGIKTGASVIHAIGMRAKRMPRHEVTVHIGHV